MGKRLGSARRQRSWSSHLSTKRRFCSETWGFCCRGMWLTGERCSHLMTWSLCTFMLAQLNSTPPRFQSFMMCFRILPKGQCCILGLFLALDFALSLPCMNQHRTDFSADLQSPTFSLWSGPREPEDVHAALLTLAVGFGAAPEQDLACCCEDNGVNASPIAQRGSRWLSEAVVVGKWKEKISSLPSPNLLCKSPLKTQPHAGAISTEIQKIWDFLS